MITALHSKNPHASLDYQLKFSSDATEYTCLYSHPLSLPSPSLPLPPSLPQGWSKEQLLEAWMEDPTEVCEKAGVQLPANLGTHNLDTPATATLPRSPGEEGEGEEERECGVCVVNFTPDIEVPCGHVFCRDCWREYLHQKIEAGDAHSIVCPEYGCFKLVPIVSLVAQ